MNTQKIVLLYFDGQWKNREENNPYKKRKNGTKVRPTEKRDIEK